MIPASILSRDDVYLTDFPASPPPAILMSADRSIVVMSRPAPGGSWLVTDCIDPTPVTHRQRRLFLARETRGRVRA
jgi:hypothetical protein